MDTFRSFGSGLPLRVVRMLVVVFLVAAAVAAFGWSVRGSVVPRAAEQKPASGTIGVTQREILFSYRQGRDVVQERLVHRQLTGTFSGVEVAVVRYAIHPDHSATIRATSSCSCTLEGKAGTVTFADEASVSAAGDISAKRKVIDATGGLAGLRSTVTVTGPIAAPTQAYSGHYAFGGDD